jgi:hypothetical protein
MDGSVVVLDEDHGCVAAATKPVMLEAAQAPGAGLGRAGGNVEDVDAALSKIVERFAASRIGAVIHHGMTPFNVRTAVGAGPEPHAHIRMEKEFRVVR